MFTKLRTQLVLAAVLLIWTTGGLVAGVAYLQLDRGIRREARARVEAAVNAALRLLEDGACVEGGEEVDVRSFTGEEWARILLDRYAEEGVASGFVLLGDEGLSLIRIARGSGDGPVFTAQRLRDANHLPDALRGILFAGDEAEEPPTVTIFEGPRRIATNVRVGGRRAVGTLVSAEVARAVLDRGEVFNDRAFVVDRWTITCYLPIPSPEGQVIGMLYAGLDEEPYVAEGRRNLAVLVAVILAITALISIAAVGVARRVARPLTALTESSRAVAEGRYEKVALLPARPEEIGALSAAFNTMVERVDSRTEELAASRKRAEKALADYLEVLSFVAHELKSPVAGALTALDVIDEGYAGEVPEKMRPRLASLRRYLSRGLEIAHEFNHLSRLESPGFELRVRDVEDVRAELIEPAVTDVEEEARRIGTTVAVEGGGAARVDPQLIRIVLDNLLGNAVKYGEAGTEVRVETSAGPDALRVGVRNEGVGVPEDRRGELFGKFVRIQDPKLKGRKGSGVGLYLCRRIVELHGGRVGVEGDYGRWVRFWFEVPAS